MNHRGAEDAALPGQRAPQVASLMARRLLTQIRPARFHHRRLGFDLEVTFLGTSAASAIRTQPTAALLLSFRDQHIMVDCGARALGQLRQTGIDPARIDAVVLTHWHADHTLGLTALVRAALASGHRSAPLRIYGPAARSMALTLDALGGLAGVELITLTAGQRIPLAGASLSAFMTDHTALSLGYSFQEDGGRGRRVVFSGDTRPTLQVINASRDADLLVHEATFTDERADHARRIGHSTASQAAVVARTAGVKALALTHVSARDDRAVVLSQAKLIYPAVVMPADLEVIRVRREPQVALPGAARLLGRRRQRLAVPPARSAVAGPDA